MVGLDQANFFIRSNYMHEASKVNGINANKQQIPANTIPKTNGLLGPQATTASLGFGTSPAQNPSSVVTQATRVNMSEKYGTTHLNADVLSQNIKSNFQNGLSPLQNGALGERAIDGTKGKNLFISA